MQMQWLGSASILYININVSTDAKLNFDANVDVDAKCERTMYAHSYFCKIKYRL